MERIYLLELLLAMPAPVSAEESNHVSVKLEMLLNFLEKMDRPGFSGLLFAKQRATCAAYVGWSSDRNRKGCLGDLLHRDMQRDTLDEFKVGRKNLIVTTDVLEEGIDVSACSLVICYDKPANLKSFVQRRGRARHRESTYALMISNEDELLNLHKWQELEQAMIKAYQDDERRRREVYDLEATEEHVKERLWVEKTR
ncbi:Dicer-like protein 2 [Penicillium rubens]|nr:Dicer-like protein 2 [Penicillium rubens]